MSKPITEYSFEDYRMPKRPLFTKFEKLTLWLCAIALVAIIIALVQP